MTPQTYNRTPQRRPWRMLLWGGAALLLAAPAVAMRYTEAVHWGPGDFVIFGLMLATAAGLYELAVRMTGSHTYRAAAGFALGTGFLLVWINLAVGIVGEPSHPANLLHAGVLLLGLGAALLARFRASAMAPALLLTALAQAGVAVGLGFAGFLDGLVLSLVFAAMWAVAAHLFRRAAQEQQAGHHRP